MSGILKTTSNGLRPQSFARRAVIKVSCSSNIVPSVAFCTTLKSNGKVLSQLMGLPKTEGIEQQSSGNNRKFH